jgi:hypothetical protein
MINKLRKVIVSLVLVFFFSLEANAAKPLIYERGGATNAIGVVNPGDLTLEGGVIRYNDEFNGEGMRLGLGEALMRYGLHERFELRTRYNGVIFTNNVVGFDNLILGFKTAVVKKEKKFLPEFNITGNFEIPIGRSELRNPGFSHSYELAFRHGIYKKLFTQITFIPSFISRMNRGDELNTFDLAYVFNLSYRVTEKFTAFSNIYGTWGFSSFASSPLSQDIGFYHTISDNVAIDLSLNWGLNESAPDFGVVCGFVLRLLE